MVDRAIVACQARRVHRPEGEYGSNRGSFYCGRYSASSSLAIPPGRHEPVVLEPVLGDFAHVLLAAGELIVQEAQVGGAVFELAVRVALEGRVEEEAVRGSGCEDGES